MTTSGLTMCESVTERVALGEPLGELRAHVEQCSRCKRTIAMPSRIAAAAERPDPGLGFAARMTIGAQNKLVVRRRRRIVGTAGASMAVAALAAFVFTRSPSSTTTTPDRDPAVTPNRPVVEVETPIAVDNDDLVHLVNLADTKRAARESARWGRIRKPLAPYVQLVKGVEP
jgi:hypothetical protein